MLYLYHVNSREEIEKCVNSFKNGNPKLYIAKENGFWAGTGMYFWDNYGNAQYWLKQSKKKHPAILKARVTFDDKNILDLTDKSVLSAFQKKWLCIAKRLDVNPNVSLGKKINTIIEIFDGDIKLVKELGLYPSLREDKFLNLPVSKPRYPHVTSKVRVIYCIKDVSVLSNLRILDEG